MAKMVFDLLMKMRRTAKEGRKKVAGRGDIHRAHAAFEGQCHERTGRAFREAIEAMLHTDKLQFGPGMIRLGREEQAHGFQRLAQARRGHPSKLETEPRHVAAGT